VREQRAVVSLEVPVDGVDVAPLALGRPLGVAARVLEPGGDVDLDAHLVAEEGEVRVRQRERRVVGERGRDADLRPGPQPEQVAHTGDVRRRRVVGRGERVAVVVTTAH
jgi:hypothetical protein